MAKQTYEDALRARAQHVGAIIAQVPDWNGTNWTDYNHGMHLDSLLLEEGNVWFFRPGNQRARIEFQEITFKGYEGLQVGEPERYDKESIAIIDKVVNNRNGKSDINTEIAHSETNSKTQQHGFTQALKVGAELSLEVGTEYAKFSAKVSTEATSEWSKLDIASRSETISIKEDVATPPGVHERIKLMLYRNNMRERITGSLDLEHKVVVVSARPDNSYYYVLVWNSFSDFLRCVRKRAPQTWTGAKEMRNVGFNQVNLDHIGDPSTAEIDCYNEYDNALTLEIERYPIAA